MTVRVRRAVTADREFILGLVPRLRAFGPSPLRPLDALDGAERRALDKALATGTPDSAVFVAELDNGGLAGVAHAETAVDYFTGERHGHLAVLAVDEGNEGKGVGRALMTATEMWAATNGYRLLTLNVFAANARARSVYERAGFEPDFVRYVKELTPALPADRPAPTR
ncbi:MAG: GNAT family N-acetyltransferase [Gemmatimonadaceae bacterium]